MWHQVVPSFMLNLCKQTTAKVSPVFVPNKGRYIIYKMVRISIYIDGANFFYGLRSINKRYTDFKFDFQKFINFLSKGKKLSSVKYYNASLKQNLDASLFRQQQRMFDRIRKISKCEVILCRRQRRTNSEGGERYDIKGDDIHLAIDMLKDAYENSFDEAVLVSGDGDFTPLVKYVKKKGKKVYNYHFSGNISLDLLKECNGNFVVDKKMVNRCFLREEQKTLSVEDTKSGKKIKKLFPKTIHNK